jgi:hypothetical protein
MGKVKESSSRRGSDPKLCAILGEPPRGPLGDALRLGMQGSPRDGKMAMGGAGGAIQALAEIRAIKTIKTIRMRKLHEREAEKCLENTV